MQLLVHVADNSYEFLFLFFTHTFLSDFQVLMSALRHTYLCTVTHFFVVVVLRRNLTLMPRLECNGAISAHHILRLLSSSDSSASASWVASITGMCHYTWLSFVFLVEMRFLHIGQTGLKLPTSSDPSTLTSQSAGITGVSHLAQPERFNYCHLSWLGMNSLPWDPKNGDKLWIKLDKTILGLLTLTKL